MTTRSSAAAATGLPADRRSLLSGAALASLVAATAAVPAIAAEQPGPIARQDMEALAMATSSGRRRRCRRSAHRHALLAYSRVVGEPHADFWTAGHGATIAANLNTLGAAA